VLAGLVVDCQFDFVGLVHVDVVVLAVPPIGSRELRARRHVVLHFDGYKRLGPSAEATRGGVIDIFDGQNADGELAGERLSHVGHVDAVVCRGVSGGGGPEGNNRRDMILPSGESDGSMSICSSSYLLSACFRSIIFCLLSTRLDAASALLFLSPSIWYS